MTPRLAMAAIMLIALAGSAVAQERQWTLDASDQDAYLVFGVPESDDVGISLWCKIHQGKVNFFLPEAGGDVEAGKDVRITLEAGTAAVEIVGKTEVNEDAGGSSVEAQLASDNPLFPAMIRADRFRVGLGAEKIVFPLAEADVEGLLALCRKP
jgi:hypothetical protein